MRIADLFRKHPDELLTSQEVCLLLRVSQRTLYRLIKSGKLPCTKIGRSYRFRAGEMRDYYDTTFQVLPHYFRPEVLQGYLDQPAKYEVETIAGGGGYLKIKEIFDSAPASNILVPGLIRFHERTLPHGERVIILTPKQFDKLPPGEIIHWRRFEIT